MSFDAVAPRASRHPPRGVVFLLATGAILLISIAVPALAIVAAWPFLIGLPAWFLVARVAPQLNPPGRLGVAVAAGIALSTHLTFLVALAVGFGRATVFLVTALLAAATWALMTQRLPGLAEPPRLGFDAARRALREHSIAFALSAGSTAFVLAVLVASAWHLTAAGWVSGGWNWSDFLVHVSIASSIQHGNFPPQVPYFAGVSLTYHWFGDFHSAILATAANLDVIPVLIVSNALLAGALALCVYELAVQLTGVRRVGWIALVLVILGGGMGFIRLFIDIHNGLGSAEQLVSTTPYDSNFFASFPYFRISSIFGTALLDQRATAYGLPILVSVVLLMHVCWARSSAGIAVAGILASLLCPFQFFAFPALYLILLIQLIARRAWRDRLAWRGSLFLFAPIAYAAVFIVRPIAQQHEQGVVHAVLGWPDAPIHDGFAAVAFFYLTNLGLPFVLSLVALAARRVPHRRFLGGWTIALFLVPNVIVVSAVTLDANKFFQLMWIPVAILAAWLIRGWSKALLGVALSISVASAVLIAIWHVEDNRVVLSAAQEAAGRWIEGNTPQKAVFVTDAFINSPVDISGRLRLTTYAPYVSNLGLDPAQREADVHRVYCGGDITAAVLMRRYGATYVLSSGGLLACKNTTPTDFTDSPRFETVYDSGPIHVWRLRS